MAKKKNILCDKTEIVMSFEFGGRRGQTGCLNFSQISTINFKMGSVKKLFKQVPSEMIEIITPKFGEPIPFYKINEGEYFEEYKKELREFAKRNRITLHDDIGE